MRVAKLVVTEYLRGTGWVVTVLAAVLAWLSVLGVGGTWPGPWQHLAFTFRESMFTVGPLVVAVAAWQAGRERRRGTVELLSATPRPPWRRITLSWASITLGAALGLLVPLVVGAALVAQHATYSGGDWWWLIPGTFLGAGATAALGAAIGVLVPLPILGPIIGIVGYTVLQQLTKDDTTGFRTLMPSLPDITSTDHVRIIASGQLAQALWYVLFAAALIALASARRKLLSAVPAALALVAAVFVGNLPEDEFTVVDPQAGEEVCLHDGPTVCTDRVNAFGLGQIAAVARPLLTKVAGIPGAPTEVRSYRVAGRLTPSTSTILIDWTGELLDEPHIHRANLISSQLYPSNRICPWDSVPAEARKDHAVLKRVAGTWWTGDPEDLARFLSSRSPAPGEMEAAAALLERLNRLDITAQRKWIGDYFASTRGCDWTAMRKLMVIP